MQKISLIFSSRTLFPRHLPEEKNPSSPQIPATGEFLRPKAELMTAAAHSYSCLDRDGTSRQSGAGPTFHASSAVTI